ncbi:MAG: TIGR00730 family Rossman fold protein [Endomicrobia bacterium]|nr:TIGR00730 family Rossman fold protein [Endomicrobiia bacterium]
MEKVCVFCGASLGRNKKFRETAVALGKLMAKENIELVYGGGSVGLMGVLADSVLESGGKVTGVIPEYLKRLEVCHNGVSELIITKNMHERKNKMYDLADYFLVLPGGIGTIDELAEVLTWSHLCIHKKACALININGYFDDFIRFLNKSVEENFFKREHMDILIITDSIEEAFEKCRSFVHPEGINKWVDEIKGNM